MSKIVLLKDIYALKEQKEKELRFYSEKKKELEEKLYWLERDLRLTKEIIKMIEEERVPNVQSVPDL
jgi:hypothetical protein